MGIDEGTGILVESGVNGLTINGNTFSGLSTEAAWCDGTAKNILVSSNLCIDCGRKIAKQKSWLRFSAAASVLIKDNLPSSP
jgi:hypothetical protein